MDSRALPRWPEAAKDTENNHSSAGPSTPVNRFPLIEPAAAPQANRFHDVPPVDPRPLLPRSPSPAPEKAGMAQEGTFTRYCEHTTILSSESSREGLVDNENEGQEELIGRN